MNRFVYFACVIAVGTVAFAATDIDDETFPFDLCPDGENCTVVDVNRKPFFISSHTLYCPVIPLYYLVHTLYCPVLPEKIFNKVF